jgi:hypothetical protein
MKSTKRKIVLEESSSEFSMEDSLDTDSEDEMNSANNLPEQNEEGILEGEGG